MNPLNYKKIKNLFLSQSCLDAWEDYERSLSNPGFITWDYLILTASNEEQAHTYARQLRIRRERGLLPERTHYAVLADPGGKRVGSGGATFHALKYIAQREEGDDPGECPSVRSLFAGKRILVIHSGGDSKRVPQYSACGKLFSPVPRQLPNGYASTLFDEFVIGMSGVPNRMREGMLVLSGDVLLLFNPLQIDFHDAGAAAISMKERAEVGKNHGVYLNDGNDYVGQFLHKQSEDRLRELGAVNAQDCVDLDTGAVLFSVELLVSLYGLISTNGRVDEGKFSAFVNEEARISFYGDFLYPLAAQATLEQYLKEAAEGTINDSLLSCRRQIWDALSGYSMRLISLSPAEFIHFGTTAELKRLVTEEVEDYEFLGWKRHVLSTASSERLFSSRHAYIGEGAAIEPGAYIEDSYVLGSSRVGTGSVLSCVRLQDLTVPEHTVLHTLRLKDGHYVTRLYGVQDNPKALLDAPAMYLGVPLDRLLSEHDIALEELWEEGESRDLWKARLYPVMGSEEESVRASLVLYRMAADTASREEIRSWQKQKRTSLCESFNAADTTHLNVRRKELENRILADTFLKALQADVYYSEAFRCFGARGLSEDIYDILLENAEQAPFSLKIRIYYALSRYLKEQHVTYHRTGYDVLEGRCFFAIQNAIYEDAVKHLPVTKEDRIVRDHVEVALPVRVNWGGGWTDTPPHCIERGGVVLNAALLLNGNYPIRARVERIDALHVEFASTDFGVRGSAETTEEIQDCHNPYDSFVLHKAALIACGIVPLTGGEPLPRLLQKLGGGIRLSTEVVGIPQGSGLGTSSILSGACVKAIFRFLGKEATDDEIYEIVLSMEQLMSTGGGWQDQVGGLTPGIKYITTKPGIHQKIMVERVELDEETGKELNDRFALIYTGQRRLARNLLRDIVGGYLGGRPESLDALKRMAELAAVMKYRLERGDVDGFAALMNEHWELSKQLDAGSTNTCIEQIFLSCEDLIDGRFIAGAGGGGFLQVILKRGVCRQDLTDRLHEIFQDSGVQVWDSTLLL